MQSEYHYTVTLLCFSLGNEPFWHLMDRWSNGMKFPRVVKCVTFFRQKSSIIEMIRLQNALAFERKKSIVVGFIVIWFRIHLFDLLEVSLMCISLLFLSFFDVRPIFVVMSFEFKHTSFSYPCSNGIHFVKVLNWKH